MDKLKELVDIFKDLHVLHVKSSQLAWVQFTAGYDFGIDESYKEISEFMKNKDHFDLIKRHQDMELSEVDQRRVQIAYDMFKGYHQSEEINELQLAIQKKSVELAGILNTFRFKLDGKEVTSVELNQVLTVSDDRELRKKAYLAKNQINKPMVDAGFLSLIEMRKELASKLGYASFIHYRLDEDDLDISLFDNWEEQVKELLPKMNEMRSEYAKKYVDDTKLYPWDTAYVRGKIAPTLSSKVDMLDFYQHVNKLFTQFGFNLDDYNITYDVYSRQNKSEWGYNFPIDVAKDSRILANVKDQFQEYKVLLHETGHGVHSFLKNPEEVILNSGVNGIVTEGIANLFGALIYDENFYSTFFADNMETVKAEFEAIKEWDKLEALRAVERIKFDQKFYLTDNKSLDDIYDMYWTNSYELLETKRGDYEPPWAFLIHHTTHPIYLHNYFMGDVTCEMLAKVFNKKHGTEKITDNAQAFGKFLYEEVIQPSGTYTYAEMFEKISGEKFSLKYLL